MLVLSEDMQVEQATIPSALDIGKQRLDQYKQSKLVKVSELPAGGSIEHRLRVGDILSSKAEQTVRFAIYAGKELGNEHCIIEKRPNQGEENPVKKLVLSARDLLDWYLFTDCRYTDTYDTAVTMLDNHLDGAFNEFSCDGGIGLAVRYQRHRLAPTAVGDGGGESSDL